MIRLSFLPQNRPTGTSKKAIRSMSLWVPRLIIPSHLDLPIIPMKPLVFALLLLLPMDVRPHAIWSSNPLSWHHLHSKILLVSCLKVTSCSCPTISTYKVGETSRRSRGVAMAYLLPFPMLLLSWTTFWRRQIRDSRLLPPSCQNTSVATMGHHM